MTSKAIVNKIEGQDFYLMHLRDYDKKEKTERNFWSIKVRDFKASNPDNITLTKGDIVEFFVPEGKTIIATFIVLILPLLVFILSYMAASAIGLESEKVKALISTSFMVMSFFIYKLLKKSGYKETLPVIIGKVEKRTMRDLKKECSDCGSCSACD